MYPTTPTFASEAATRGTEGTKPSKPRKFAELAKTHNPYDRTTESMENVSSDLIWELVRPNNSYLVKRRTGGGVQFSRDPLNLVNKHSRKYEGFVTEKAIGIQPADKGGVILSTKKEKSNNKPASGINKITWGSNKSNRKIYKAIVNHTAKSGYRSDLRAEAVARASATLQSQRSKKDVPEKKLRGSKAKKAAEKDSS